MEQSKPKARRCAIYTRKSSEEGLEQDFNSLHAQREACEAFIKSQTSEGWKLIKSAYDDGGLSGGTMERPALKRLLADIGEGLIDVVVVYKVDRLTRSLADFAKMVELFDAHGVSFVAVTQQFNTTTSMGRLTLNVLLSFAQFEREVTGERIRDKIAASKRKGMWMGGVPPLGYDVHERRLVINPSEADTVRHIYERYLELGCVRQLSKELEKRGIVSKVRISQKGIRSGGCRFSRGALYELLANPIYIGEIRHKQERHPGQHEAILPRELWERVQQRLNGNAARGRGTSNRSIASPLAGKLFDADGKPLYVQGATKGRRRYRYYVSRRLVNGSAGDNGKGWRLAAPEIERAVTIAARHILNDRAGLLETLEKSGIDSPDVRATLELASNLFQRLQDQADAAACLVERIERAELRDDGISVMLRMEVPCSRAGVRTSSILNLSRFVPLRMKRRGVETRIIIAAGDDLPRKVDPPLLKAVARSRAWFEELAQGRVRSLADIARREGIAQRYVERLSRLAFAAPRIVEAICQGRQPAELNAETLLNRIDLPLQWSAQLSALGID
ncbi:recombinase family protein [Candidatus Binatus sp.]|jgi:site-specific DNA recombinase|uniref:recombinase family protein n=1 Tax=Candidatus Binatus sp. TaxID=2811406 RepID=UPI003BBBBA70